MPPLKRKHLIKKKALSRSLISAFAALVACTSVSAQNTTQRNQDESFLDISQERLTFDQSDNRVPQGSNIPSYSQREGGFDGQNNRSENQQTSQGQDAQISSNITKHEILRQRREQEQFDVAQPLPSPVIAEQQRPNIAREVENRLYPMRPDEIRQVLTEMNERQGAAVVPSHIKTIGTASQYEVDMTLGANPPIVRIEKGLGAMVNFVDAQGTPWPIVSATNFHQEAASVAQVAAHVLSVSANSPYLSGSVGVILEGLSTPIQFVIIPATDVRDYRVDLRIPQLGPDSTPTIKTSGKPSMGGGNIKDFLYGATPDGATRLKVSGEGVNQSNTRAWQNTDGRLVLRTSASVISPSWVERQAALDGTSIYVMPSTPVVRVSVDGSESTFYLDGLKPMTHFSKK